MEDILVKLSLGLIICLSFAAPIIIICLVFKKLDKKKWWEKRPVWLKLGLKVLTISWVVWFILGLLGSFMLTLFGGKIDITRIFLLIIFALIFSLPIAIIIALISYFQHKKR